MVINFPIFPHSAALEKKWWHRLARVVIYPWQILCIFASIGALLFLIVILLGSILLPSRKMWKLTSPYGEVKFINKGELAKAVKNSYAEYRDLSDNELEERIITKLGSSIQEEDSYRPESAVPLDPSNLDQRSSKALVSKLWYSLEENIYSRPYLKNYLLKTYPIILITIPILLGISFIPTILYRVFLYVIYGSDMKLKKSGRNS